MMQAQRQYQTTKDVILLGEHGNGKKMEDRKKKSNGEGKKGKSLSVPELIRGSF